MRKVISFFMIALAIFGFATWQYRLLTVLFVVLLNKDSVKRRLPQWKHSYKALVGGLLLAIFIAIPNYLQHGRIQLHYLSESGERTTTPLFVYALNVICPEEEMTNVGLKASAVLPPSGLSPVFKNLGSRFIRDAQKDFWSPRCLSFYSPYNNISMTGSNPGSALISQVCNEYLGTNYDGIYIIKPQNYDSEKTYPLVIFCHGYLGNWELYNGLFCDLKDCIVVCMGTRDLSGIFTTHDIGRMFNKYIPYLESLGYNIDGENIHLMGLSNGGTAANVALKHYSNRLKSITYISTSCDVTKRTKAKVLLIGGGKDRSSTGLPSAQKKLTRCGTDARLFFEEDENHFIMVHKKDEIIDFLKNELFSN